MCSSRRTKKRADAFDAADDHDDLIRKFNNNNSVVCYTDGSASPNPGPADAGAVIFNLSSELTTDIGLPLGYGTNNLGDIAALALALAHTRALTV